MRKLTIVVLAIAALMWVAVDQRHFVFYQLAKLSGGAPPPLLEPVQELPTTTWFDDYYTIDEIAPGTYAIGEPRYAQQNYNYLIVGTHRALLFDAGPGVRDILPVVQQITDLPVVFLPSHFHYDHVGNGIDFAQRAVVDLPYLRARAQGNELTFTDMEHLGPVEGFAVPTWNVDHWWLPGQDIDLGNRSITILHTPGHSKESISVFDSTNNIVLSGDFLYEGMLYVFVPGSSLHDYLQSTQMLMQRFDQTEVYYGAHRITPPGPPLLRHQDLADLQNALLQIKDGSLESEGFWPAAFYVNDNISILADPYFLHDWNAQ